MKDPPGPAGNARRGSSSAPAYCYRLAVGPATWLAGFDVVADKPIERFDGKLDMQGAGMSIQSMSS